LLFFLQCEVKRLAHRDEQVFGGVVRTWMGERPSLRPARMTPTELRASNLLQCDALEARTGRYAGSGSGQIPRQSFATEFSTRSRA
jgi:hypothetical protein